MNGFTFIAWLIAVSLADIHICAGNLYHIAAALETFFGNVLLIFGLTTNIQRSPQLRESSK